jgi:hypothetical protein
MPHEALWLDLASQIHGPAPDDSGRLDVDRSLLRGAKPNWDLGAYERDDYGRTEVEEVRQFVETPGRLQSR